MASNNPRHAALAKLLDLLAAFDIRSAFDGVMESEYAVIAKADSPAHYLHAYIRRMGGWKKRI